jgi:2-oxoglutarate dehydrogenase E2 component (dihydrolipoamide succinyltransferase)
VRQVIFEYAGDDVSTATVDYWHVDEGDAVEEGDDLVELRTEEGDLLVLPAPTSGVLRERFFEQGDEVDLGDVIATIDNGLEELEEEEDEEKEIEDKDEHDEDDIESFADDEEL